MKKSLYHMTNNLAHPTIVMQPAQTDPASRCSHSCVPSQTADKNVPYPQNQQSDPHFNRGLAADLF